MIVSPELMSASSAPSARPLKSCETKFDQLIRPVIIVKGKMQKDMKGKEDYYDVIEIVPGAGLMQKPDAFGCKLGDYT